VPEATAEALLFGRPNDLSEATFTRLFGDVVSFLTGTVRPEHPNYQAWVSPARLQGVMPQVFGLGTTRHTLRLAAEQGTSFAYALFIGGGGDDPDVFEEYRRAFRVGPLGARPRAILSVAGVCAETDAEAEAICSRDCEGVTPNIVGSPERCRVELLRLHDRYQADEIVFLEIARPLSDRLRSCELLSNTLELRRLPQAISA
jgi:alkanesulfonate monooxygenase SsuD/methylene tetrahydromethanopterin reductase-like flavin-dependent oxidoreductase (luciferase family)